MAQASRDTLAARRTRYAVASRAVFPTGVSVPLHFGSSSARRPWSCVKTALLGTAHYFAKSLHVEAGDRFVSLGPISTREASSFRCSSPTSQVQRNTGFRRVDIPTIASVAVRDACTAVTGFDPVLVKLLRRDRRRRR